MAARPSDACDQAQHGGGRLPVTVAQPDGSSRSVWAKRSSRH